MCITLLMIKVLTLLLRCLGRVSDKDQPQSAFLILHWVHHHAFV